MWRCCAGFTREQGWHWTSSGPAAERFGGLELFFLGTALAALGYALAGLSARTLFCVALALSGAGSLTWHPIASGELGLRRGGSWPARHLQFHRRFREGRDFGAHGAAADFHVLARIALVPGPARSGNGGEAHGVPAANWETKKRKGASSPMARWAGGAAVFRCCWQWACWIPAQPWASLPSSAFPAAGRRGIAADDRTGPCSGLHRRRRRQVRVWPVGPPPLVCCGPC